MKYNVFLDLDETLISSEILDNNSAYHAQLYDHFISNNYVISARPHLQSFLDYVFLNHNVSIWTAAGKDYAVSIYERFIRKYDKTRKVQYFLYRDHSELCEKILQNGTIKPIWFLWDYWKISGMNAENTLLIDDNIKTQKDNPINCIPIQPFKANLSYEDTELLRIKKLLESPKNILLKN